MPRTISFIALAGWLALVAGVSADIVWSGTQYQRAYHDIPSLDFNQDGTNDFTFSEELLLFGQKRIWIEPADGQIVIDNIFGFSIPNGVPLPTGINIASSLNDSDYVWENGETSLFRYGSSPEGLDYGGLFGDGYLGISFNVEGSTHYGWIEMSHDETRPDPYNNALMIHGWAWESEADTAIIAGAIPEPSSVLLVLLGGLTVWVVNIRKHRRPCR